MAVRPSVECLEDRCLPAGLFDTFPVPTVPGQPPRIVLGPDGNLWFTEFAGNRIGRITPAGVITEFPIPTIVSQPFGIAAGPDGNLWFTESRGNKVGRITPTGTITEFPVLTLASQPYEIALGPDGNLWFTESKADQVGRITPAGVVTEFKLPSANSNLGGITAGPDGNLWFTEPDGNRIAQITTAGVVTEFKVPAANSEPVGFSSGADGALWFAESGGGGLAGGDQVGRITTAGVIHEFAVPAANSQPRGIAQGPDGNLWFTEFDPNANAIGRLNRNVSATGPDQGGGPDVRVFDTATGQLVREFPAYDLAFQGGVRVAVADVTGDGIPDIITAPGPTGGPDVRVFDGVTGLTVREFMAYDPAFTGGVYVAVGDVTGDGTPDIVTGPEQPGGPDVRVFDGKTGNLVQEFYAYVPAFQGGVRVAVGDVAGDTRAEIITGPGPGGGPDVRVFAPGTSALVGEVMAYDPGFAGGVYVATGDTNGDGKAEVLTGPGSGMGPTVHIYRGLPLTQVGFLNAYDPGFGGGVRVGAIDVNGDGRAEILTGPGPSGGADVRVFDANSAARMDEFFAYDPRFLDGIFVGGLA